MMASDDGDLATLLLIRHFETRLLELFGEGKLNGTTHTCLGQEHVPVALGPLLTERDVLFSNHRGHGHYLARFGDPVGLLAEIMGRRGAICHGVGGSQHLLRRRYLSTGVQGESVPIATGVALRHSRAEPDALSVVHIGDGTWGEGAVYEGLNMAALWRLPLVIVVEHNEIAQSTPTIGHLAGTIGGRAAAFGVAHHATDAIDVRRIRADIEPLLAEVRQGRGPLVLEFRTVRLGPHSKGDDTRAPQELAMLAERDWYTRYAREDPERFDVLDRRQRALIDQVAAQVAAEPPSIWEPVETRFL